VIGGRAWLVFNSGRQPDLAAATAVADEVREWLPKLGAKKHLDSALLITSFHLLPVSWHGIEEYGRFESEARGRMKARDEDDWPTVALALALNRPIWTQDKDFSVSGIKTYRTGELLDALGVEGRARVKE
jgi:predicted nucleic acid-binding protein